uniref:AAA+ ATPase domain-containing protein n=1 Tax=Strigamia maritima TaxID=126957 RepID=T1JL37_STRMM
METTDRSECPICHEHFAIEEIQNHAEDCLIKSQDVKEPVTKKSKLSSSAAWGCLAPSPVAVNKPKINFSQSACSQEKCKINISASENKEELSFADVPLAEKMRPFSLSDYFGQDELMGRSSVLKPLIESNKISNMILWGPPGCGKTSLARIISNSCKVNNFARFVNFSAATSGIGDVREVIKQAKAETQMCKRRTILFMDEIHRFNKLQQDTFLPHIESGTITLIGATTENPSFSLNNALLSRCRVFVLEKLPVEAIEKILFRATDRLKIPLTTNKNSEIKNDANLCIEKDAVSTLAQFCDGDARIALNSLQLAIQHSQSTKMKKPIQEKDIKEALVKSHTLYDRAGDEHYNCISALHKSIRGSDDNASLYWLARMLAGGEDPLYVARRLIRCASEDIGLADPTALQQAVCAYQACQFIGVPECKVILAQCVVYLARCPKSVAIYQAYSKAENCIAQHQGPLPGVPLHLRNAPTTLMKNLGYGKDYKYNPDYTEPVNQKYLPDSIQRLNFFE